jgi:nuclear GTP-binding protein
MAKGKNHSTKRTTLHNKYKIQKKVKEHHRKIRKEEKAKAKKGIKLAVMKRKDPGIPNLWPFKEELLREVEVHKENVAKQKIAEKLERQRQREKARKAGMSPAQQLAELKANAMGRQAAFEMQEVGYFSIQNAFRYGCRMKTF